MKEGSMREKTIAELVGDAVKALQAIRDRGVRLEQGVRAGKCCVNMQKAVEHHIVVGNDNVRDGSPWLKAPTGHGPLVMRLHFCPFCGTATGD